MGWNEIERGDEITTKNLINMNIKNFLLLTACFFYAQIGYSQSSPIYENLPVGKYPVGFKIFTITDDSRVTLPEYNYLGKKNEGDRSRKITIHLWYPAKANPNTRKMTYGEYCYNHLLKTTNEKISEETIINQLRSTRGSIRNWFGEPTDESWKKLIDSKMLAEPDAQADQSKFSLLIGDLRPLSTTVTNELLASNGYVVAMVTSIGENYSSPAEISLKIVPDMQMSISHLIKNQSVDKERIGTFGFSGSGFVQVHLAMFDNRIKALADIESGLYMEGLYQAFSASDYYNPTSLRIPFLHIFSRDLSKSEKYFSDFENKTKFSERYRLILNQPKLHHWDFAAEGYTSCIVLKNRGAEQSNIQQSFEIANTYLLNFFNDKLKSDPNAKVFLANKPALAQVETSLWDIRSLNAVKPPPNINEFENIIRKKGIEEALAIVNTTLKNDSSSNLNQGRVLNSLGYSFLNEKKYKEAIGVFKLNTELHPDAASWINSLSEAYENSGDKENMKKTSQQVLDLLARKTTLTNAEKSLKETAERRIKI